MTLFDMAGLVLVGFVAGMMNSMVGGGSMLTVPALIFVFPELGPRSAVGTNRFVICFFAVVSSWKYWQMGEMAREGLAWFLPFLIPGAFAGALVVGRMEPDLIEMAIGVLTFLLVATLFMDPTTGEETREPPAFPGLTLVGGCIAFVLGLYGGFYGAGVTTLLTISLVFLVGATLIQGIATAQVMTLVISLAASIGFILDGHVNYVYALPLGAGMVGGGYLGPVAAVYMGNRYLKFLFAALAFAAAGRLLWG